MIIFIFSAILCIYLIARLIWPLGNSLKARLAASFALLLISQYHNLFRLFSGTLASPELPTSLIMLCGWLYVSFLLAATFCLLRDIGIFISFLLRKAGLLTGSPLKSKRILAAVCILSPVLSGIGLFGAVRIPDIVHLEIQLAGLPREFDGLRIVQLSDIHASSLLGQDWVAQVVDRTNALKPDLIVITGDMADGQIKDREADIAPLAELSAPLGVYAVNGNHEYYSDYAGWMDKFPKLNLEMLHNAHKVIARNGAELVLAGVTDPAAAAFGLPGPDIEQALLGAPAKAPIILLAHQPSDAAKNAAAGVSLQLSGHTHGGQIIGLQHTLIKWVNKGFISGLYQIGGMQLYISKGTGLWSGHPVRIGVPSEITEITLRSKQPSDDISEQ